MTRNFSGGQALPLDEKKARWLKTARRIYWTLTVLFAGTMLMAGIMFLAGAHANASTLQHLGYPQYVLTILGTGKLLGAIAILWGRFPVLKEWAYIGYSFCLIGAAASHAFAGDGIRLIITPLAILLVVLVSYRQWKTGWM
jgi:hypothetical protein